MYLKRTSSFNEKPSRSRRKKKVVHTERPEELNYSYDAKGELTIWIKKTQSFAPVKTIKSIWFLTKLQTHLKQTGKFPAVYKAVSAEIQRRIDAGEITEADLARSAAA
jgi:hypothetical protein